MRRKEHTHWPVVIRLPGRVPPSQNKRERVAHWSVLRRLQKEWNLFVFAQVMQHDRRQMERYTKPFLVKVTVYHIGQAMDYDGFVGSCKPVFDALVNNRYMPDDSRRHIRRQYREVLVKKKEQAGTLIQIWPDELTELERVDA